ncbi:hypothetical protein AYX14_01977 [Cryptococcus neoformans]|nr:hypothetical protein AYX14_01977 [Cryptococcus neoformans var. grubii]
MLCRRLPRYNSPWVQVLLVSFVFFTTVGMFQAIGNLGAGGTQNIKLSDTTNSVLYVLNAFVGVVAGSINNVLGPRLTLFMGALGYVVYVSALWVYQVKAVAWWLIVSGAIVGAGAGLIWAAQGAIMMSYPLEKDKGRSFSMFWAINNCGSLMGGLIALGIDISQGAVSSTATSTYIAFLAVMLCGLCLSWTLLPPGRVVRNDGSIVEIHNYVSVKEEIKGLWAAVKTPYILILVPMFFSSNYFLSYQAAFAFALFDAQTRALNAVIKSSAQILGAIVVGLLYDKVPMGRRNRGLVGIAVTSVFIIAAYGWGLSYQLKFTRSTELVKMHWNSPGFGQPIAILVLYDIGDALYQGSAYWIMGALTNDPFTLARYAGLYKAVQAAGSAISFGVDAAKTPYLNEHLSSWIMLLVCLPLAAYVIFHLEDTNYKPEEVVYVDNVNVGPEGVVLTKDEDSNKRNSLDVGISVVERADVKV